MRAALLISPPPPNHRQSLKLALSLQPRRKGPVSLRVFGCLPGAGARGCTAAGVRKASREETAGEFILKAWCQVATSGRHHLPVQHDAPVSAFEAIAKDYPSFELRLSLMTQSGALMFELRAAEQAITSVQGAVVAYAPPFTRPAWPPHGSSGGWG